MQLQGMRMVRELLPGLAAAPDVHPLFVHLPLALLPIALVLGVAALRGYPVARMARITFLTGTAGLVLAATTGLLAQTSVPHPSGTIVATHRTWMLFILAGAVLLAILMIPTFRMTAGIWVGALFVLNVALVLGADRGGLAAATIRSNLAIGTALPPPRPPLADPSESRGTETETSAPERHEGERALRGPKASTTGDPVRGAALYERLECADCHGPDRTLEAPGIPPGLDDAGSRLRTDWVERYLSHPFRIRWLNEGVRPVSRMPDYRLDASECRDLAAFLSTRIDSSLAAKTVPRWSAEIADDGRQLVRDYGCRGCHVIGSAGAALGPDLNDTGARLRPAYVLAFLKAPKSFIPGTPMNDFHLWRDESVSMTQYLSSLREADRGSGDRPVTTPDRGDRP
ncbi:MAG: cytochrome c [Candidatus Eisenbacteria bacterium]